MLTLHPYYLSGWWKLHLKERLQSYLLQQHTAQKLILFPSHPVWFFRNSSEITTQSKPENTIQSLVTASNTETKKNNIFKRVAFLKFQLQCLQNMWISIIVFGQIIVYQRNPIKYYLLKKTWHPQIFAGQYISMCVGGMKTLQDPSASTSSCWPTQQHRWAVL